MTDDQFHLKQHEIWRLGYRQKRYLIHASDDALDQRFKDVINNLTTLTPKGQVGLLPVTADGVRWMILFTHLLEEYGLRGRGLPTHGDAPFVKPTAPDLPGSAKIEMPGPGRALVKLGKRIHMQELYEKGRIRIAPAASYDDPSLNPAIRDDELKFDQILPGTEVKIIPRDKETGEPKDPIKVLGDVTVSMALATNYYVYCMTHTLSHRLFDDFAADSCVIIKDPTVFGSLLREAVQSQLLGWLGWNKSVNYVDPYLHPEKVADLTFSKHFRFWYQQEYRFVWLPDATRGVQYTHLDPLLIELGSLGHIAELVSL